MSTGSSPLQSLQGASSGSTSFNAQQYVNAIIQSEQGPEQLMQQQVATLSAQGSAWSSISTQLQTLQSAIFDLDNFSGPLNAFTTTSSNSAAATATASTQAQAGSHTLSISNLATTSSQVSNVLTDGNTTFTTGSFQVQVGSGTAQTVTVTSSNNTLNGIATAINQQAIGVTAGVVTDASGARLELVSQTSGAPGNITISSNTSGLTFSSAVTGANAKFTVDGVSLSSTNNAPSNVLPGVSLSLLATTSSPVTISVNPDTTQATTAIQTFVTAYNAVITSLNQQFAFNSSTQSQGPLGSDSTAAQVQQQLLGDAAFAITGNSGITNLASMGVSMNEDGTLAVDTSTLQATMGSNYSAVVNFFQQISPAGFGANFNNDITNINAPGNGPVTLDQNGIQNEVTDLNQQISDFQANLNLQEQQLLQQYSQVAVVIQQMPTMLSQVQSQIASIG